MIFTQLNLSNFCCILLSFTFQLSFYMKSKNIYEFAIQIKSYNLLPKHRHINYHYIALIILVIEAVSAILLVLAPSSKIVKLLGITLLIAFTIVSIMQKVRNQKFNCSCFGKINLLNSFPLQRNIALIGFMIFTLIYPPKEIGILELITIYLVSSSICLIIDIINDIKIITKRSKG